MSGSLLRALVQVLAEQEKTLLRNRELLNKNWGAGLSSDVYTGCNSTGKRVCTLEH